MHRLSFVFDGNVFTINFHRCHLALAVPGVPFDQEQAANSIDVVAPQVCNLTLSKDLHLATCSANGLVGLWSCGLINRPPALAFLAECTVSQPRQGKLQGVCLFDRILNPPLTALADFP